MRADQRDPVIKQLRKFKPTKFSATLRDGTVRELVLATRANKWELLLDTIGTMPWVRIEAQDEAGRVLGAVDRDDEDAADDDDEGGIADDVERLTRIMKDVQTSTMVECRRMFADQTRVNAEMAAGMLESMRVMQESYQMAIKMTAMSAVSTNGETGEQDKVMQMIQMAMAMKFGTPMPAIPATKPAPAPPTKAMVPKPNGHGHKQTA
jgi:hypothetical protein